MQFKQFDRLASDVIASFKQARKPSDPAIVALKSILEEEFGGRVSVGSPKTVKGEWSDQTLVTVKASGQTWHVYISHEDGLVSRVMKRARQMGWSGDLDQAEVVDLPVLKNLTKTWTKKLQLAQKLRHEGDTWGPRDQDPLWVTGRRLNEDLAFLQAIAKELTNVKRQYHIASSRE